MKTYQSWGRYPKAQHEIFIPQWREEAIDFNRLTGKVLPYGQGRSYGDVCLNDQGTLLDTAWLNHFLAFDPQTGILRTEAGVTFAEILKIFVPQGWFLPVTPGTQYVTVGGAIANDVHGKNHHRAGTFGRYVRRFELLRSSGERLICSSEENREYFKATIGGLGLTGLILWAEIEMKSIPSPWIEMERIRFENLDEFFQICASSSQEAEYTVSWVDCFAQGNNLGRGHFMAGEFADLSHEKRPSLPASRSLRMPVDAPSFLLNTAAMKLFNQLYYTRQKEKKITQLIHYKPFFYPLDTIESWNRIYGKKGFLQYQCIVPHEKDPAAIHEIFSKISQAGTGSFLAVLKMCGDIPSPGMLSFPRKGVTLALDFPNEGEKVFRLLDELDEIVCAVGGTVNPSKDARMKPKHFDKFFPRWREFSKYIDPKFSSGFWRRVTEGLK